MKFYRYITLTIIIASILLVQAAAYAQVNFSDVSDHWAKKEIGEMVDKKFILGYPDGTFKPDKEVTKLDTLIMAARVLGVDKEENKEEVISCQDTYGDLLSTYNIYGKREISFLLGRNILTDDELDAYLKGENAQAYTKRYEAAVIFTKIMGKEKDVKNKTLVILSFVDSQEIPQYAKSYVEFMNSEQIMNGVTKTEFKPSMPLTRAQIAIMLLRVSSKLETEVVSIPVETESTMIGVISYIDLATRAITVKGDTSTKNYSLLTSTPIKVDNSAADINGLEKGFNVTVKTKGNEINEVSATSRAISKTISGPISSILKGTSTKLSIKQGYDVEASVEQYDIDYDLHVIRNGSISSIEGLKVEDDATVYILANNKIGKVVAEDKDKIISGVVESLTVDDKVYLTVKTDEKSNKYEALSDVVVYRNNSVSALKYVKIGDKVSVTLRYKAVKEIRADSDRKTIEGTIEEIFIAKSPKITIRAGNNTTTYDMTEDAVIKIDNVLSGIYDLRLGCKASFDLDNNTITGVLAQKKVETLEVRGSIKMINLSLGVITLSEDDASNQSQIYINSSSTKVNNIIKATNLTLNDLKEGQKIIAYGKNDRGVFVTSLIVVMDEE